MANESPHRHFGPTCCVPWAISLFVHILFNLQYNLNANLRRAIETHVKIINKFAEMKCVERDLCNAKNRTIRDRWEEIKSIWRKNGAKLSLKSKWMCVNTSNRMKCELKLKIDGRMELPKNRSHKRTHATHHSEQLILRSTHTQWLLRLQTHNAKYWKNGYEKVKSEDDEKWLPQIATNNKQNFPNDVDDLIQCARTLI